MPRIAASTVPRLLPYLEAGLAPAASAEQYAGRSSSRRSWRLERRSRSRSPRRSSRAWRRALARLSAPRRSRRSSRCARPKRCRRCRAARSNTSSKLPRFTRSATDGLVRETPRRRVSHAFGSRARVVRDAARQLRTRAQRRGVRSASLRRVRHRARSRARGRSRRARGKRRRGRRGASASARRRETPRGVFRGGGRRLIRIIVRV